MVDIMACPVCKNKDLKILFTCQDFTVSHETFTLKQCANCSLAITTPWPGENNIADYYKSSDYISHSGKSSGGIGSIYRLARTYSLNWKKNLVQTWSVKGSILDFGCGTGDFLSTLQKDTWNIGGVEPFSGARTRAEELTGKNIFTALDEIPINTYDAITAWHVLEHVSNLVETINLLKSHLKKDGTIFIAVPNYQSPDAESYKEHWAGFDVPRHVWHFSKQSMEILFKRAGLKLVKTVPMRLDAYYISLLSEKYKNKNRLNISCLMRAIFSGLKSNLRARKSLNHSSLIYIAKIHEV